MANIKSTEKKSHFQETKKSSPLSFKNLTGAFVILFVGLGLSLIAFVNEIVMSALVTAAAKNNLPKDAVMKD